MFLEFLLVFIVFAKNAFTKKCHAPKLKNEPYNALFVNNIPSGEYACPGEGDLPTHTECCWSNDSVCCPPAAQTNYDFLTVIALTVIIVCLIIVATTLVSCFWTKGWCYHCCRVNYTYSDVAIYTLDQEEDRLHVLMPYEGTRENGYDPVKIHIKPIEDL